MSGRLSLPHSIGVSNLDAFRIFKETDELDLNWFLDRLFHKQPETEAMKAGKVLHNFLAFAGGEHEVPSINNGEYRFDFDCDVEVVEPDVTEWWVTKYYGDIEVRGIVDGQIGNQIIDYKTTEQLDADRFMESYQWRFYLDMTDCDQFLYQVFVIKPFGRGPGPPYSYSVKEVHHIKQYRYPGLHEDCERLVDEYHGMMGQFMD